MRIRPNIFLVSSVLLTLGLFWLLPSTIENVRCTDSMSRTYGFAALAITIVGLIVVWTGLAAGNRVSWVIMAVIVWVWALPIMTWPVLRHGRRWTLGELREWVVVTWREDTFARTEFISTVVFLLMLVGLILPVKALLRIGKPKYLVPSAKESFRAMEITLVGIGIILGVLLLVLQFKIWSEPPHDFGYGTALRDCEAIPEQMDQFLSLEEMDSDEIQIETVVGSITNSEKNLKPLITYFSTQKKKDFGTLVAALKAADELPNQKQKAIQFVKALLPYKDALKDESYEGSLVVFVYYGLKQPSKLSSPTRAKLGSLVKQLDTAAQAAKFDSGECPTKYLVGKINIYPLLLEDTFWHGIVEFPSAKDAPIMEIRFMGLRGVFRYLLDEMTARTGDTFVHLDGESL